MSDASRKPRTVLIGEHEYARAPRFAWPGEVVLGAGDAVRMIPGTWQLEFAPRALVRPGMADAVPPVHEASAWHERMVQILTLQEPGVQLRVGTMHDGAWQTLEVTVPSRPPTRVVCDREALARIAGVAAVALHVHLER